MSARGIRNNNPGNIRVSKDKWQGLASPSSDGDFFIFQTAVWGIRAMARLLINYQDKSGRRTVTGIISRWAPAADNNDTTAYIRTVAKAMGVDVYERIDLHDYRFLRPMLEAMILVECGSNPYNDAIFDEALRRAGVVSKPKPLTKSKELAAAGGVGIAGVASAVGEAVSGAGEARYQITTGTWIGLTIGVVLIGLAGFIAWNRIKARKTGVR